VSLLLALLLTQLTVVSPVPAVEPNAPTSLNATMNSEGSGTRINMNRVMFLENQTLEVDGSTGPLMIRVEDETFTAEEIGAHSEHRTYFNKIDALVQEGRDLDIELKLAMLDGRLLLYWRETFQHRFWRYGLVTIEGQALFRGDAVPLRPVCEGRGGSQADH